MPQFVTLTTDLGKKDYYVAAVKAEILSFDHSINIIDVTHEINTFDISQGVFNLKNSYHLFPPGTIHIFGVQTEKTIKNKHVVVKHKGHYFIGADNGFIGLMFNDEPDEIYEINIDADFQIKTFSTKDVFAKVACNIISGKTLNEIGTLTKEFNSLYNLVPTSDEEAIVGLVMYFDHYGNLHTNITKNIFDKVCNNRPYEVSFRGLDYRIKQFQNNYFEVPKGEKIAFFNHSGILEIAINGGNAQKLFGVKEKDVIRIEFQ